jgi:hypothetical protein
MSTLLTAAAHSNARTGLRFAPHIQRCIEVQQQRLRAAAAASNAPPASQPLKFLTLLWADAADADAVGLKRSAAAHATAVVTLPKVPFDKFYKLSPPVSDGDEVWYPRCVTETRELRCFTGFDGTAADNVATLQATAKMVTPRCGVTGRFFTDEGVVHSLMSHMAALPKVTDDAKLNPFWVTADHPDVASGYLSFVDTASPCVVSDVSFVYPATAIASLGTAALHPKYASAAERMPGMNAFTGKVSANAVFNTPHFDGGATGWVSLEQALAMKLLMKGTGGKIDTTAFGAFEVNTQTATLAADDWGGGLDGGFVVELADTELFNAAQLVQPGKLAYARSKATDAPGLDDRPLFV